MFAHKFLLLIVKGEKDDRAIVIGAKSPCDAPACGQPIIVRSLA